MFEYLFREKKLLKKTLIIINYWCSKSEVGISESWDGEVNFTCFTDT